MGLFGRSSTPPAPQPGHDAFWAWWADTGAARVGAGIAVRSLEGLTDELTARVSAVADGLVWEIGPGITAQHQLVVSAGGDPAVRAAARRWLRAAPDATELWEYADAKPADADVAGMSVSLGDTVLELGSVLVAAERVGNHVDVRFHHPDFPALPEQVRNAAMFIALDAALGEVECETWVGAVEAVVEAPLGATALADLAAVVEEVRQDALTDDGQPVWVLMEGQHRGMRLLAAAQVPLAPTWAPHLDQHVPVDVPYAHHTDDGLPTPATLDDLRALESHVAQRLGDSARLVAHETCNGARRLHFYADSTTPAAAVAEAAVGGWQQGEVAVGAEPDPGWHAVRHLRT